MSHPSHATASSGPWLGPCAVRATAAYQQARAALSVTPSHPATQRAVADAHANLTAARFVDAVNTLGADDPLPDALCPACPCAPGGPARVAGGVLARWEHHVARWQHPYWERLATAHQVPLEHYLLRVADRMRRVVARCHLYVRVPVDQLPAILALGRLGGCSDAGQWGGGCLGIRQQTGAALFGDCPRHSAAAARHVYAYLASPTQHHRIAHAPLQRRRFGLDRFGEVDLELAPHTARRATITFGALADVTDCGFRPGCCPRPLDAVDHLAFPVHVADRGFGWNGWITQYRTVDPLAPGQLSPLRHILQAQVRGPVMLADMVAAHAALPLGEHDPEVERGVERGVAAFNADLARRQAMQSEAPNGAA